MTVRWAGVLALCTVLAACGFRPLLTVDEGPEVRGQLAAVEVREFGGRPGQLVRNALLDELSAGAPEVPPRYVLLVDLTRRTDALGIQLDSTITRYNLTLVAQFRLLSRDDNRVLYSSTVRRVASYNVRRAPFTTLAAERNAERRAAIELGNNISTLLGIYFAREEAPA